MKSEKLLENIISQLDAVKTENVKVICNGIKVGDVSFLFAGEDHINISSKGINKYIFNDNLANVVKLCEKQRILFEGEMQTQNDFNYVLDVLKHHS